MFLCLIYLTIKVSNWNWDTLTRLMQSPAIGVHAEKSFRNIVNSNHIWIVITPLAKYCHDVRGVAGGGGLKWASMMPRGASFSESCTYA